jgi:DNA-binding IclR family transcriptional regulator
MARAAKENQTAKTARNTKISRVIDLLERNNGASLDELIKATSWQKHTVRSALSGLKKKGYEIERARVEGVSRYAITKMPAAGAGE